MSITGKIIYLIAFNIMGTSITAWLIALMNHYTLPLALLTGTSLLVINIMKVRGMWIDQKIKLKNLKDKNG